MRLQYISDLHLDQRPKTTYDEILKPTVAPVLVLLGDVCSLKSSHLRPFFEWCSERWTTVIWIPGNLEVWGSGLSDPAEAARLMKILVSSYINVQVLYCEAMGSDDGIVLLGCPLWRRPRDEIMLHMSGQIWVKSDPCPTDQGLFLNEYNRCRRWLTKYLVNCDKPVVLLGHYAPLPWLTEEEWIQERSSSMNEPEMEVLLKRPLVAWLFGHCHIPTTQQYTWTDATGTHNTVLLTSNPYFQGYKKDAVVRIDPSLYEFSESNF